MTSTQVSRLDRLDPAQIAEVVDLARAAGDTDGADPLDEQILLRLRDERAPAIHLVARGTDETLTGYAHLDTTDPGTGVGVGLVVHPAYRRRGIGRALAQQVLANAARPVRAWAHGDHPSAAALAVDLDFRRARVLWQLRRPLSSPQPEPRLPDGVTLRAFRPGVDDEAWLALNARAFAEHPEQGRWTADDLRVRLAEPWFDPAGFLLAVESATGRLLGFHWTKVHERPGSARIGEVYVLGVDPSAHGGGLGRALTTAGLTYLREQRGLDRVMLYVDESNTAAVALYERIGFARWSAHVNYQLG
ncbi:MULTISPECIES: mycothiol synthase [Micromonospora]|uniref:Mycothiol acetyltransferase n=1 Tax=Micromonospora maris TaxID=1003110 RepID=A0A9X0I4D0_9ACTN|nr:MULTISPECIES: mycothiol synthase [Micromonospora]AEB47516.1 mycothiol biosynthesis acetyltransferase [Micromonospora maris AB-18-032]KUJ46575.1 mycothiol synthase [Micromonospora maris]RUL93847.1 mycothiol synthase [Verrucosispora sp. FIM060022]